MFNRPLFFSVTLILAASAYAQSPLPVIAAVSGNANAARITIQGVGFGKRSPLVQLAGIKLVVASASDTSIVAQLPAATPPGSYLLLVQNGSTHLVGLFEVSLGVQGPPGPPGPKGDPGQQGPAGSGGTQTWSAVTALHSNVQSASGQDYEFFSPVGQSTGTGYGPGDLNPVAVPILQACTLSNFDAFQNPYYSRGAPLQVILGYTTSDQLPNSQEPSPLIECYIDPAGSQACGDETGTRKKTAQVPAGSFLVMEVRSGLPFPEGSYLSTTFTCTPSAVNP